MRWLRYMNPLVVLTDYWREQAALERADRTADRNATADVLSDMQRVVMKSLENSEANTRLFERFLSTYDIPEPPKLRTFDEDDDDERYIKRKQSTSQMPKALAGLSREDQFKAILDNLERFNLGD